MRVIDTAFVYYLMWQRKKQWHGVDSTRVVLAAQLLLLLLQPPPPPLVEKGRVAIIAWHIIAALHSLAPPPSFKSSKALPQHAK
jgi:hypothetical protein